MSVMLRAAVRAAIWSRVGVGLCGRLCVFGCKVGLRIVGFVLEAEKLEVAVCGISKKSRAFALFVLAIEGYKLFISYG